MPDAEDVLQDGYGTRYVVGREAAVDLRVEGQHPVGRAQVQGGRGAQVLHARPGQHGALEVG